MRGSSETFKIPDDPHLDAIIPAWLPEGIEASKLGLPTEPSYPNWASTGR